MFKSTTLATLSVLLALAAVAEARAGRGTRCYYACKRPHSPPDCFCESKRDCTTKVCGVMESCQMYLGRIPQCVKYRASCDLEKVLVPCERRSLMYYFDKERMRCVRVATGQCPNNANSFASRRECSQTCYVRQDMELMRGGRRQWGVEDLRRGALKNRRGGVYRHSLSD